MSLTARFVILPKGRGKEYWNHLAAVASIDAEVAVQGHDDRIGTQFRHAHQARIGEIHREVASFATQRGLPSKANGKPLGEPVVT